MRIRKRAGGGWCMEHQGVEAPYTVIDEGRDKFSVYADDDEGLERPIAHRLSADACGIVVLRHFEGGRR